MLNTLAGFLGPIGLPELLVIAFIGLLIFGKRLPEVGKNMGQFIVKFKRGLTDTEQEIDRAVNEPAKIDRDASKTVAKPSENQVSV